VDIPFPHGGPAALEREAELWRIGLRTATAIFLLPFAGGAVLGGLFVLYRPLFDFMVREDSVIEWATAVAFLVTSVLAGLLARGLWRQRRRKYAVLFACFTLACFLAAGEEISWGERLFGFAGPDSVRDANVQAELTFHNLGGVFHFYLLGQLAVGLYGSLGPLIVHRRTHRRPTLRASLLMPPLFLSSGFLLLALHRLSRDYGHVPVTRIGEWAELCVACALAFFVGLNVRRIRSEARVGGPAS